jgi:hypothetical protein
MILSKCCRSQVYYASLAEFSDSYKNTWNPIPELLVPDGDVTILFLSANDIHFLNQVDDPWYSAHVFAGKIQPSGVNGSVSLYVHDDPVRTLGCIERYQFCNASAHPGKVSSTALHRREHGVS